MAYNNENKLRQILKVQEVYLEHHRDGVSDTFIFNNYIKDQFCISIRTFRTYMATNAKMELRNLENEKTNNDK